MTTLSIPFPSRPPTFPGVGLPSYVPVSPLIPVGAKAGAVALGSFALPFVVVGGFILGTAQGTSDGAIPAHLRPNSLPLPIALPLSPSLPANRPQTLPRERHPDPVKPLAANCEIVVRITGNSSGSGQTTTGRWAGPGDFVYPWNNSQSPSASSAVLFGSPYSNSRTGIPENVLLTTFPSDRVPRPFGAAISFFTWEKSQAVFGFVRALPKDPRIPLLPPARVPIPSSGPLVPYVPPGPLVPVRPPGPLVPIAPPGPLVPIPRPGPLAPVRPPGPLVPYVPPGPLVPVRPPGPLVPVSPREPVPIPPPKPREPLEPERRRPDEKCKPCKDGKRGPKGDDGDTGPKGDTGGGGDRGDTGPRGSAGATGPQGPTGANGPQGLTGSPGPQGPIGANGPQGLTGSPGPRGPIGANGPQGLTGSPGPQGPIGANGPQGLTGSPGPRGLTGVTGPQGLTGATGPQGPTGAAGPKGDKGDNHPDLQMTRIQFNRFISCTRRNALGALSPFDVVEMDVILGLATFSVIFLNDLADRKLKECEPKNDPIAVVPDWWQVRLGADRPQLMVTYAAKFADGTWDKAKYVISIPHWKKSEAMTGSEDFPIYRKGQYQGVMVLTDNSKIIVNAFSPEGALMSIDKIALGVQPLFLSGAVTKVASRRGRTLSSVIIYPRSARYFATGQLDLTPNWVKKFV